MIFSDDSNVPNSNSQPTNHQQTIPSEQHTFHARSSESNYESSEASSNSDEEDAYYANRSDRKPRKGVTFSDKFNNQSQRSPRRSSLSENWRSPDDEKRTFHKPVKNSYDRF